MKTRLSEKNEGVTEHLSILHFNKSDVFWMENRSLKVYRNDIIVARENCRYRTTKSDSLTVIDFSAQLFDPLFYSQIADCRIFYELLTEKDNQMEYLFFHTLTHKDIDDYYRCLKYEAMMENRSSEKMIFVCLTALFTALDRSRQDTLIVQNSTMGSKNRFGKLMQYIGANYKTCTLGEVAALFGYNPDYLSYRFKQIVGMTFHEKILSMRLNEAKHLLLSTDLTIEEISAEIGFSDKSWFMKKFKEVYQLSPAVFRKEYRKKQYGE